MRLEHVVDQRGLAGRDGAAGHVRVVPGGSSKHTRSSVEQTEHTSALLWWAPHPDQETGAYRRARNPTSECTFMLAAWAGSVVAKAATTKVTIVRHILSSL